MWDLPGELDLAAQLYKNETSVILKNKPRLGLSRNVNIIQF